MGKRAPSDEPTGEERRAAALMLPPVDGEREHRYADERAFR